MKNILHILTTAVFTACIHLSSFAQAPQQFRYQSVARDASGNPVANSNIGLRISIRNLTATGTIVYQETHTATTDALGLFTISVGTGVRSNGFGSLAFRNIPWGVGEKFLEVEADFTGGTSFVSMGTSQLLSVPYTLFAENGFRAPLITSNLAIGNRALQDIETFTSIGFSSFSNTAVGHDALRRTTAGYGNTAIGTSTLTNNTTGNGNTATGNSTLFNNTIGSNNTATGEGALHDNTNGNSNTAIGHESMHENTTGSLNAATGARALYNNTIGSQNTANGQVALESNTTGFNNTAIGYLALRRNTTGGSNTAVGAAAFSTTTSTTYSNSTAIGYNAQVTASNMVRIGNTSVTSINGAVAFTVVSDKRFKKNIREDVVGLPFIMKLRPVTYHFDMDKMAKFTNTPDSLRSKESDEAKEKVLQTGFIAQEVEKASEDLGYDFSGVDKPENEEDYYGLRYAEFTVPLVKAVQEQQELIEQLKQENKRLKNQLNHQETVLNQVESENKQIRSEFNDRLSNLEKILQAQAKK